MRHTFCLKIILNEKEKCSIPRTRIFEHFLAKCCHQSCGDSSLSLQLHTGSHVRGQVLAFHLWYVDCNLGVLY